MVKYIFGHEFQVNAHFAVERSEIGKRLKLETCTVGGVLKYIRPHCWDKDSTLTGLICFYKATDLPRTKPQPSPSPANVTGTDSYTPSTVDNLITEHFSSDFK